MGMISRAIFSLKLRFPGLAITHVNYVTADEGGKSIYVSPTEFGFDKIAIDLDKFAMEANGKTLDQLRSYINSAMSEELDHLASALVIWDRYVAAGGINKTGKDFATYYNEFHRELYAEMHPAQRAIVMKLYGIHSLNIDDEIHIAEEHVRYLVQSAMNGDVTEEALGKKLVTYLREILVQLHRWLQGLAANDPMRGKIEAQKNAVIALLTGEATEDGGVRPISQKTIKAGARKIDTRTTTFSEFMQGTLDALANPPPVTWEEQELASIAAAIKRKMDASKLDAPVIIEPFSRKQRAIRRSKEGISERRAYYSLRDRSIHYNYDNSADITVAHEARVIGHEMIHAATEEIMYFGRALQHPQGAMTKGEVGKDVGLDAINLVNRLERLLEEAAGASVGSRFYGFTDTSELVAEAFSNPDFQAQLAAIDAPRDARGNRTGTVWDEFIDDICAALEIPVEAKSVLSSVIKSGAELMRLQSDMRESGSEVILPPRPGARAINMEEAEMQRMTDVMTAEEIAVVDRGDYTQNMAAVGQAWDAWQLAPDSIKSVLEWVGVKE